MTNISKSNLLAVKGSSMTEFGGKELERQLTLYQVFLKLYEHHSSLLDEILQLENSSQPSLTGVKLSYVQGIMDGSVVYVMTNLCEGKTLSLQQPQQIWTIGRDRSCGIHLSERYVSRRHAAIQYIDNQGFYLIDFNSTNGSYLNGEPVYQPTKLKDGDRIRLGSITFSFFVNLTTRILPTVAVELLMQLVPLMGSEVETLSDLCAKQQSLTENSDSTLQIFCKPSVINKEPSETLADEKLLIAEQKSKILDRFFSREAPNRPI